MKHTAAFIIAIAAFMSLLPGVGAQNQSAMQEPTQAITQAATQPDAVYKLIRRSWKLARLPAGGGEPEEVGGDTGGVV